MCLLTLSALPDTLCLIILIASLGQHRLHRSCSLITALVIMHSGGGPDAAAIREVRTWDQLAVLTSGQTQAGQGVNTPATRFELEIFTVGREADE